MDISDLKPAERVVEILHPATGEELGVRISLLSLEDQKLKQLKRRLTDERIRLESKGKSFKAADLEENGNEILLASVTGWEWYSQNITFHGQKPEFNRKNFLEVIGELPWFKAQIEVAISDEQAFFQT